MSSKLQNLSSKVQMSAKDEKEASEFYKDVRKEEEKRKLKIEDKKKKQRQKEDFIRKFFCSCENSPGGTLRLNRKAAPNPARNVAIGENKS